MDNYTESGSGAGHESGRSPEDPRPDYLLLRAAAARLAKPNHGAGVPGSTKRPLENATYLAECMLILAQLVDRELTPKKRGRPRKTAQ